MGHELELALKGRFNPTHTVHRTQYDAAQETSGIPPEMTFGGDAPPVR
jgi:hypothetical protein